LVPTTPREKHNQEKKQRLERERGETVSMFVASSPVRPTHMRGYTQKFKYNAADNDSAWDDENANLGRVQIYDGLILLAGSAD